MTNVILTKTKFKWQKYCVILTVSMRSVWLEFGVESHQGEAIVFLFMEGHQINQHLIHTQVSVSKLIKESRLEQLLKPLKCNIIKPGWSHSNSVVHLKCLLLHRSRIYSTLAPLLWAGAMIGASCLAGLCCSVAPASNREPYLKTMLCHSLYRGRFLVYLLGELLSVGFVWPGEVKNETVENDARPCYYSAPEWPAQGTARS